MKKVILFSFITLLCTACSNSVPEEQVQQSDEKLLIATSFYPLTFVVEQIGQNMVEAYQISAQGADPHSYEPTAKQIQKAYDAYLLFYNGKGQDVWAERIHEELESQGVSVVVATEIVELLGYEEHDSHDEVDHHDGHEEEHDSHSEDDVHEEEESEVHEHEHNHGEWDPHVWLDPILMQEIARSVVQELIELDPDNAADYTENFTDFVVALDQLDRDMQAGLQSCQLNSVIVSHDAFRYLANRYGFETLEIAGLSPNAEPSPARLADLSDMAQSRGIEHVFFETHVSPALSDTLANEIGADILVLHSIETLNAEESIADKSYFDLMRQNLRNLRIALQCS